MYILEKRKVKIQDGCQNYELNFVLLGADHLIRGGGLWFLPRDQTFFFRHPA